MEINTVLSNTETHLRHIAMDADRKVPKPEPPDRSVFVVIRVWEGMVANMGVYRTRETAMRSARAMGPGHVTAYRARTDGSIPETIWKSGTGV